MNSWSTRIKTRLKELELTQEKLAKKMGITRGAVTHYLAGRRVPPLKQFEKLAAILKVNPSWLQFGTTIEAKKSIEKKSTQQEKKSLYLRIPIISLNQVAEHINIKKIPSHEIKKFVDDFYTNNQHWFAFRVKGDSMTSPSGHNKNFHEHDIIIVDSDKNVTHGDFVIALLPGAKEATFKQYVVDGGIRYLKPLNPQYPITEIDDSTHICGVLILSWSYMTT